MTKTETFHAGGFLVSEDQKTRSRDQATILSGQNLLAGAVLGAVLGAATVTPAATAGNTGTGSIGTVTADANAMPGDYKVVIIEPGSNAGIFEVFKPNGLLDGTGTVAVAYNGSINFTLADATDFISGDSITVTVARAASKYAAYDPTATNGSEVAAAILYGDTDASSADKLGTIIVRAAEINKSELVWGAGVTTTPHKTAAYTALAALGIIGR